MIGFLKGTVLQREKGSLLLLCDHVGYEVGVPSGELESASIGSELEVFIHTHVKEDDISLFGFTSVQEKNIFRRMISISGVGPKLALTILSTFRLEDLVECVRNRDVAKFKTVPGIGLKKAERLLLELQSKLQIEEMALPVAATSTRSLGRQEGDLVRALVQLGYKPAEITRPLELLKAELGDGFDQHNLSQLLSMALRHFTHAHFEGDAP